MKQLKKLLIDQIKKAFNDYKRGIEPEQREKEIKCLIRSLYSLHSKEAGMIQKCLDG